VMVDGPWEGMWWGGAI